MQRPVMNPSFNQEPDAEDFHPTPRRAAFLAAAWRVLCGLLSVLFRRPAVFGRRRVTSATNPGNFAAAASDLPFSTRLVRGLAYRALFVPILIALSASVLVFAGTHPPRQATLDLDPRSYGVYYDPVSFTSADGTDLEGWLVPVVDARMVLEQQDRLLRSRYPAIVLVHDHGQSPQQMLPLVAPLHEEGFVVLVVGLRGQSAGTIHGGAGRGTGQTFGLNESLDVRAAVKLLRRRAFVDDDRVAVLGVGTGANAAMLAAREDERIAALVLARPAAGADEAVARRIGPDRAGLRWMQPVCKWTFEIAYGVDAEEIDVERLQDVVDSRHSLLLAGGAEGEDPFNTFSAETIKEVRKFCRETLKGGNPGAGATASGR